MKQWKVILTLLMLPSCERQDEKAEGSKTIGRRVATTIVPAHECVNMREELLSRVTVQDRQEVQIATLRAMTDAEVLALWEELIAEGGADEGILVKGAFPGHPKHKGELFINELLDRLVAMQPGRADQARLETVHGIFCHLLKADGLDQVVRDYSIQRALMWAAGEETTDEEIHRNPHRPEILKVLTQEVLVPSHLQQAYVGTLLNTYMAHEERWNTAENTAFQAQLQGIIDTMPPLHTLPVEVAIPLMHAMDHWPLTGTEAHLEQARQHGSPHLKHILSLRQNNKGR